MKYQSEDIKEILVSFYKFQSSMDGVTKNMKNDYFKSSYADLHNILSTIKEPLQENNLCLIQLYETFDNNTYLSTTLYHTSGQFFRSYIPVLDLKNPQTFGSCSTYLRRYAIAALLGLSQKDDDGNAATFISNKQHALLLARLNKHPEIFQMVSNRLKQKNILSFDRITHDLFQPILDYVDAEIKKKNEVKNEAE